MTWISFNPSFKPNSLVNFEFAIMKSALSNDFKTLLFKEEPTEWFISFEWIKQKDFVFLRVSNSIFSILFQWSKKHALIWFCLIKSLTKLAFLYFLNILKPEILSIFN